MALVEKIRDYPLRAFFRIIRKIGQFEDNQGPALNQVFSFFAIFQGIEQYIATVPDIPDPLANVLRSPGHQPRIRDIFSRHPQYRPRSAKGHEARKITQFSYSRPKRGSRTRISATMSRLLKRSSRPGHGARQAFRKSGLFPRCRSGQ